MSRGLLNQLIDSDKQQKSRSPLVCLYRRILHDGIALRAEHEAVNGCFAAAIHRRLARLSARMRDGSYFSSCRDAARKLMHRLFFLTGNSNKLKWCIGMRALSPRSDFSSFACPNGVRRRARQSGARRHLTSMPYRQGQTDVASRSYTYDSLGRPTTRGTSRQGTVKNDIFTYNDRIM